MQGSVPLCSCPSFSFIGAETTLLTRGKGRPWEGYPVLQSQSASESFWHNAQLCLQSCGRDLSPPREPLYNFHNIPGFLDETHFAGGRVRYVLDKWCLRAREPGERWGRRDGLSKQFTSYCLWNLAGSLGLGRTGLRPDGRKLLPDSLNPQCRVLSCRRDFGLGVSFFVRLHISPELHHEQVTEL